MAPNYPRHFLLQWGGDIVQDTTPVEQWTNTIRFNRPGLLLSPDMDGMLEDLANDVQAWHTRVTTGISIVAKLNFVKFNAINATGHYEDNVTHVKTYTTPVSGGNPAFYYPLQVAHVVSLRTGKRGPRYRGRFYIPCPVGNLSATNFHVTQQYRDGVAASAQTFLQGLGNWPGIDIATQPKVAVISGGGKFSATGSAEVVNEVRVGDVFDTVRRRRRALVENYKALPVSQ